MESDNSPLSNKKRERWRADSEQHQVLGDNKRESSEGDREVTVGEEGDKNTVAFEMPKRKKRGGGSKQGIVNCIKYLRKVKMGTGKYS